MSRISLIILIILQITFINGELFPQPFSFTAIPAWGEPVGSGSGGGFIMYCGPDTIPQASTPFYQGTCNESGTVGRIQDSLPFLFDIPGIDPENVISFNWGQGTPQSALDFLPVADVIITEEPFLIGVIIHENFPIGAAFAVLSNTLNLTLEADGILTIIESPTFSIDETPNMEPCKYTPNVIPCADAVIGTFPSSILLQTAGGTYQLILSFRAENNISSPLANEIITQENELTPGYLFAQYMRVTTGEQTTAIQTTAQQTTAIQTTAQQTTAIQTTAQQTTALQTTQIQSTVQVTTGVQQTTALQTTQQVTTAQQTTVSQTTSVSPPTNEFCCDFKTGTICDYDSKPSYYNLAGYLKDNFGCGHCLEKITLGCDGNVLYQFHDFWTIQNFLSCKNDYYEDDDDNHYDGYHYGNHEHDEQDSQGYDDYDNQNKEKYDDDEEYEEYDDDEEYDSENYEKNYNKNHDPNHDEFAEQLLTTLINIELDSCDGCFASCTTELRNLCVLDSCSPCYGHTVQEIVDVSQKVFGGCSCDPRGLPLCRDDLRDCLALINENFANGNDEEKLGFCSGPQNYRDCPETTECEQTTAKQTTGEQTTGQQQTTGEQTTEQQTTGEQTTEQQTTGEQTTEQQTTGEQTTDLQTTGEQTTDLQTTGEQTTEQVTTGEQTTEQQTTDQETTAQQLTGEVTTDILFAKK